MLTLPTLLTNLTYICSLLFLETFPSPILTLIGMYIFYVYMEKWLIHYAQPSHLSHWPRRYILCVDITNFDHPLYSPFSLPMDF